VAEDPCGVLREQPLEAGDAVGELGAHHPRVIEQAARRKRLEVLEALLGERPVDLVVGVEDPAFRVAERAGL
jgi:hypothetical protein